METKIRNQVIYEAGYNQELNETNNEITIYKDKTYFSIMAHNIININKSNRLHKIKDVYCKHIYIKSDNGLIDICLFANNKEDLKI